MDANENTVLSVKAGSPQFITIAELMERSTLSRPTVYRHIKRGSIPTIKIGRRVLIDAEFLVQLQKQAALSAKEGKDETRI